MSMCCSVMHVCCRCAPFVKFCFFTVLLSLLHSAALFIGSHSANDPAEWHLRTLIRCWSVVPKRPGARGMLSTGAVQSQGRMRGWGFFSSRTQLVLLFSFPLCFPHDVIHFCVCLHRVLGSRLYRLRGMAVKLHTLPGGCLGHFVGDIELNNPDKLCIILCNFQCFQIYKYFTSANYSSIYINWTCWFFHVTARNFSSFYLDLM